MPRNLSAWKDIVINLGAILFMILVFAHYSKYMAAIAFMMWVFLVVFSLERAKERRKKFREYCENIISSGNELMRFATVNIPQSMMVVNNNGRVEWFNELTEEFADIKPENGMRVEEFWKGILRDEVLDFSEDDKTQCKSGNYLAEIFREDVLQDGEEVSVTRYFQVRYRQMRLKEEYPQMVVVFIQEVTKYENLKIEYKQSRTVLMYVQVDNYDEIMQGLNDAEKTALMLSVNEALEKWIVSLAGFMQRVSQELFIVVLQNYALNKAIEEKFTILDQVRQIISKNGIPVTLSIGVAIADKRSNKQSMYELGDKARERLNAALSRGGDQVAMIINGKPQYFGGRAKAVEKHNRVRARVTANSIREHMESADEIFVMGHVREDFDSFGAACGVAVMALHIKKNVHVVLSNSTDSVEKMLDQFRKDKTDTYQDLFMTVDELTVPVSINPLLIVVDTHIPYLVAAPILLERISNVIVIDHHRKSDAVIKNPLIFYHEPSSSSASELVTELLMYFDDKISVGRLPATALYSGIVVDTKSFVVQTGIRTFDAAAYLRRHGADPVVVRELFMADYETTVALAKAKAQSEYFEGGLIVSSIDKIIPNVQAVAGQAADSLLTIENVRMTIVLFQMKDDVVGISARSSGTLNVQVIMEKFGGGGHQNVAGAQVKNSSMVELKAKVTEVARQYISEVDSPPE
ncbi:MAG: DHH family phosphoesterase [Selenomonadaceae bacterium]|nr:DHH family phosphoesterase [Selenomonadaceae bacterium]